MRKVAVIGLDCAAPAVVFDRYIGAMPNLAALMRDGAHGTLRSCDPPITVPAWASLFSGRDAGELGIYGFRNRRSAGYDAMRIASSQSLRHESVWDHVAAEGGHAILLGIPPSYPAQPVRGCRVSCLLTPSAASRTTWPPELAAEIEAIAPGYLYDVGGFRGADPFDLLERLRTMTAQHFRVARHLLRTRPWDFFAMVEMGPDRLQHALWRFMDPDHPEYRADSQVEATIVDYFRFVDTELGTLLDVIGGDAVIMVASDHGARAMHGGICVNEWLRRNGYLVLHETPSQPQALRPEWIDWQRTSAWAEGGYYARIFVNRREREPAGWVEPDAADSLLDQIAAGLDDVTTPAGGRIGAVAHRPERLFREARGFPPDLIVYFGDLSWRSLGGVGFAADTAVDNDTGADDANHDWDGIFVMRDPREAWRGQALGDLRLLDVASTIAARGGVSGAGLMPGTPFGRHNEIGAAEAV